MVHVEQDSSKFDELQLFLAREIVSAIKTYLEQAGLDGEKLHDATLGVAFSVAAAIDGSTIMTHEDQRVLPVLTFAKSEDPESLIGAGGSWMHEYIGGFVDEALGI